MNNILIKKNPLRNTVFKVFKKYYNKNNIIGYIKDRNNFNYSIGININNIPIKIPYFNSKIPKEYTQYSEFIQKCIKNEKLKDYDNFKSSYIYLSIDQRNVKNNSLLKKENYINNNTTYISYNYNNSYKNINNIIKVNNQDIYDFNLENHKNINIVKLVLSKKLYNFNINNKILDKGTFIINNERDVILYSVLTVLFYEREIFYNKHLKKIKCMRKNISVNTNFTNKYEVNFFDKEYKVVDYINENNLLNINKFRELYYKDNLGIIFPKKEIIHALEVLKPITIINSFLYSQDLDRGDVVVKRLNNKIYGIKKNIFDFMYKEI